MPRFHVKRGLQPPAKPPKKSVMQEPAPLHDLTDRQLDERHRTYPRGNDPTYGLDLGAEVERRERLRNRHAALAAARWAAVAAIGSLLAALASWITIFVHK